MGNGQVERMNRTLLQMLKTLTDTQKSNWKESLNKLVYAYNCTRCEVTGYSPFYLLYGRSPRLPVEMFFGLSTESDANDRDYVKKWKQGMEEAYAIANKNAQKAAERSKKYYDTKVRSSVLQSGERVLIKNLTPRGGPGKLRNYWEDRVHTVVRQMGSALPIYEVRPERGKGRSRVLHRNLLMPCDQLPFDETPESADNNRTQRQKKGPQRTHQPQESNEDSEDEYNFHYVPAEVQTAPKVFKQVDPEGETEHRPPSGDQRDGTPEQATLPAPEENQVEQDDLPAKDMPTDQPPPGSPSLSVAAEEPAYQRPQRERCPPKRTTYDQLGTPTCCGVGQANSAQLPQQSLPLYPFPGLIPWLPPIQPYHYRPPYMYGLAGVSLHT